MQTLRLQLKRLPQQYHEELPPREKKRYQQILSKKVKREDELIQAAGFLCQSVDVILYSLEGDLSSKTLDYVGKELNQMPEILHGLSDVPLRYLSGVASLVEKNFLEKEFLFADYPKHLNQSFDKSIEEHLMELKAKIQNSRPEEIDEWMRICQSLSELLQDDNSVNRVVFSLGSRLAEVFQNDVIRMSRDGSMTANNIELIFHPKLRCENLAPYLRFLHFLNGELTIQMQMRRRNDTSNEYKEKIPKELNDKLDMPAPQPPQPPAPQPPAAQLATDLQIYITYGEKKKELTLKNGFKLEELKALIFEELGEDPNVKEIAKIEKPENGVTVDTDRDCSRLTHGQHLIVTLKVQTKIFHFFFYSLTHSLIFETGQALSCPSSSSRISKSNASCSSSTISTSSTISCSCHPFPTVSSATHKEQCFSARI
jgi:hypothetical protein